MKILLFLGLPPVQEDDGGAEELRGGPQGGVQAWQGHRSSKVSYIDQK